jgi:hypothetical protein
MKKLIVVMTCVAFTGCLNAPHAQDRMPVTPSAPPSQAKTAPVPSTASASNGLADLEAMTFDCPKAALNAAARESARVPSQGTYQFAYFKIINDAHHASYEVYFKSNHIGEPDLRYCVSMYCQQGWDPKTTQAEVRLMSDERVSDATAHSAACGVHASAVTKRKRR